MHDQSKSADYINSEEEMASSKPVISISEELKIMMQNQDGNAPQTLDITTVHAMFKRLEDNFELRLKALEDKTTYPDTEEECDNMSLDSHDRDDIEVLTQNLEKMKLKSKATNSATTRLCDINNEIKERIEKLEINNNKKMVVLTGFYANGKKKIDIIREIEHFLAIEIGVNVQIDDFFEMGMQKPRTKVLIFQNIRDKMRVMRSKHMLKDLLNMDNKPLYINDYLSTAQTEVNRSEQAMINRNEQLDEDKKAKIEYAEGKLYINSLPYSPKVVPPLLWIS